MKKTLFFLLISCPLFAQLPSSGSLSIKSAAGSGRSISQQVDGNETGNKSLTTLSTTAGKDAPHSMTEFYGYPAGPALPGPITSCSATQVGSSIVISWSNPASGGTPENTIINQSVNSGSYTHLFTVPYPDTFKSHTTAVGDLSDGSTHVYQLFARNATGDGSPVCTTNTVTYATPTPPGVPQNITATKSGSSIIVDWDAPASGGAVTNYNLQRSVDGGTYFDKADTGTTSGLTDNALLPGHTYTYRVRAENDAGQSSYITSNTVSF